MATLGLFVQIQNLIILAKAVLIKVSIRIVNKDVLGVLVRKIAIAFYRLAKGCRILKREAVFANLVAIFHPGALAAS